MTDEESWAFHQMVGGDRLTGKDAERLYRYLSGQRKHFPSVRIVEMSTIVVISKGPEQLRDPKDLRRDVSTCKVTEQEQDGYRRVDSDNGDITIGHPDGTVFQYSASTKRWSRHDAEIAAVEAQAGDEPDLKDTTVVFEGTDVQYGQTCGVFLLTFKNMAVQTRVWVAERWGLALRHEEMGGLTHAGLDARTVTQVVDVAFGPISKEVFSFPEGESKERE